MALKKQLEDTHINLRRSAEKVDSYKDTLFVQADRVKEQIKNNIEMQIEALNQRNQWLLNQLELIKSDKLESILGRQNAIKCCLTNVECFLDNINKYSNNQIQDELEKARVLLSNDLQPFLAFRADSAQLRESLSQYGTILNQYCGHFADPSRPSISLPHMVEDEDDEQENHLKTNPSDTTNSRKMPTISSAPHLKRNSLTTSQVKSWLLSDIGITECIDCDTVKSETESFVRIDDEPQSPQVKKPRHDFDEINLKDWLNTSDKQVKKEDFSDVSKRFVTVKKQKNELWLLTPNGGDDEKELDHHDFVNKACLGGSCKTFLDCCEKENCCNRLVDNDRPIWNKWLISNNVVDKALLSKNTNIEMVADKSGFFKEFNKVLKSDNDVWLEKGKNETDNVFSKRSKQHFNLKRWINIGKKQEWLRDKDGITKNVEKSLGCLKLEEDGLQSIDISMNNNDCNKCNGSACQKWLVE